MNRMFPVRPAPGPTPPRILVIDAFDSFVDILRQYLMSAGAAPSSSVPTRSG